MLGPFNSPLAKHLHAAALASQRDGHRLSLGSRDRAGRTPPASISSIEVGAGARSPGEQLGVSSPTSPAAQRSRLAASSSAAARSPGPPADTAQSAAAQPPPPPPGPADALQQLAVSKRRAAVAAAAAAMQSPATSARPGTVPRRPASAAGTPARAAPSTPIAGSSAQPATPASAAAAGTPASAGGSAQLQPRTSFKQQAAHLLQQQQQQQQSAGRRQSLAASTPPTAAASRTSGAGSAQRPAAQRPRPLLYQQQVAAPPTASLEEAMGQLQLQGGSLAAAVGPSGTPSLAIRSRGLLTPLTTPRGRPESAAAALPPAAAATPVPLSAATPQQRAQQTQQTQAAQQAGAAAEPLLGQPLWSPMLPAGAAQAAPLGAGLLSTTRKAPRDGGSAAGPSSATGAGSGPAAEVESASAGAAQQGAGLQQEASFGEPTDNPAQLRRQLQAIVPELTLTQLPAAAPAAAAGTGDSAAGSAALASRAAQQQRPAGVADRAAAEGLLDRMHKLQAAAVELLQEQGAAATCASVAADFRRLLPEADAAGRSIVVPAGGMQTVVPAQGHKQAPAAGPSAAAAARLAKLAQLRAAGSELAAALA